jgi:hypothetical protein
MFCHKKIKPDYDDGKEAVLVSHGLCEKCLEEHYPEEAEELLPKPAI